MLDSARVHSNLLEIRDRIAAAAQRGCRTADEITLVAVTKYVDASTAAWVVEAGCCDLGESRPQQLWEKATQLTDPEIRWHFIGHLQRNKVDRTLPLVSLIHSGDRRRLLAAVQQSAEKQGLTTDVLLEVNVSGDTNKDGWQPAAMPEVIATLVEFPRLKIQGLMAMAALGGDAERTRRDFAALRKLRDQLQVEFGDAVQLNKLSMGMSGDYEAAIEEGATHVRVGSALFR